MLRRLLISAIALAIGVIGSVIYGFSAHAETAPPPVAIEVLTPRATFTDQVSMRIRLKVEGEGTQVIKTSNASRIVTTRVTVQPGAQIPWHTHHGPVFVGRRYSAGNAFVDPGHRHVHTAYNSGSTVTQFLATFFEVPADGPISIPADGPANCTIPTGSAG